MADRQPRVTPVLLLAAALALAPGPAALRAEQNAFAAGAPAPQGRIDTLVFARLKRLGLRPAPLTSDAVFLRRAYVDVIGTLPTAEETRAFLADRGPDKRRRLIDRLLERDEFADYWAMKWGDALRVKSEFPINLWPNAVQAYHRWIRAAIRDDMPYDRFARELLTRSGSNFRDPPVNFYRAVQSRSPDAIAGTVALTFMGSRAEKWPADRRTDLAAFFSAIAYKPTGEWKEEIVMFDRDKAAALHAPRVLKFPDGRTARLMPDQDPRELFAAWLTAPANPWFTAVVANRVWYWLLGRGIVHEPDDFRADNPPAEPELLAYLERQLIDSHYDLKALYRLILNSATYQLSSVSSDGVRDDGAFARYLMRPLDAEVTIDALCQITGTTEEYSSAIPEPYTFTPLNQRAIALADGSITSAFLEAFGRPPRDTGLQSERTSAPSPAARLALLNSTDVQRRVQQSPALLVIIQARTDVRQLITSLYLTILSREPTADELRIATAYVQASNRRAGGLDVAWALMNSVEFLYRH